MNRNGAVSSGQEASLPERFTWPFRYFPHRTVREAAARLTGHIDSDGRLKEIFSEGKMLGVLVVRAGKASGASSGKDRHGMQADRNLLHRLPGNSPLCGEDGIFYLAAFSGNAGGHNMLPGFVPPVFDILDPDGHFKNEERKISAITDEIGRLSAMPGMPPADERIMQLKEKRNRMSEELQEWLFRQYVVTNGEGEEKSILDIFADKGLVPPGGTGECAAPKLLHYALSHSLKPVAMGEFWYCGENEDKGTGKGNDSAVREKGRFYPSCSGKCGPLLRWMLTGVDTDNPYDFDDATAHRVKHYRCAESEIRIRQQFRQDSEPDQSRRAEGVGDHCRFPVADPVRIFHRKKIRADLHAEIQQDQPSDHLEGEFVFRLKNEEEKRRQVVDDRLRDVAEITGPERMSVNVSHEAEAGEGGCLSPAKRISGCT